MPENAAIFYRFDRFTVEPETACLRRGDETVAIEPKVFLVLVFLLENRHRLVEKQELLDAVWHDVVVTENALTRAVARLRKILDDDPRAPRFIATAHSRGYRFVAQVEEVAVEEVAIEEVSVEETLDTVAAAAPGGGEAPAAERRTERWPQVAAVVVLILIGAIALQRFENSPPPSAATAASTPQPADAVATRALDPYRIAALPMVDLSDHDDDAYFVDGLTEQMISTLSRIDGLRVVPRTTVMAYKGTDRRIAEIGRELGAGTVLEGSVRRDGEELRITVQLVDVDREETLWSMQLDRPLRDIFTIQSEVAVRVAEALESSITPSALRRIERGPTRVVSAWDHYLKGRQLHKQRTRVGLASAVVQYERALELDPNFALALAQIANANVFQALTLEAPPGWPEAAIAAAERALELDPELPEAHRALGGIAFAQGRFQRAFDLTLKAVELDPSYVEAGYNAASFAQALGRLDDAVLLMLRFGSAKPGHRASLAIYLWELGFEEQGRELAGKILQDEPLSVYLNIYLAQQEMLAGDFATARNRLEQLRRAYPHWMNLWLLGGQLEARANRLDRALESFEKALEIAADGHTETELRLARLRWLQGERAKAQQTLEDLAGEVHRDIAEGTDNWILRWQLAAIEAVSGHPDEAVGWFERAVDLGNYRHLFDAGDPLFESLRDDPRFEEQLERMRAKVATMRERLLRELDPDHEGAPSLHPTIHLEQAQLLRGL